MQTLKILVAVVALGWFFHQVHERRKSAAQTETRTDYRAPAIKADGPPTRAAGKTVRESKPVPPPPEILNAIVTISGDKGAGTGFICNFRGKIYVATNQHVLACGDRISIRTSGGYSMAPKRIVTADDADVALIECVSIPAGTTTLNIASLPDGNIKKDDEVVVPGNSKGDGVITQTPGKLLAAGPQRIEVDNPVYPGNSGSPIIHLKTGKVIGVLTEAEIVSLDAFEKASFRSKNSAIKTEVRYFGHRVDSVQRWQVLDWRAFQNTEKLIAQSRKELDDIFAYLTGSSTQYKDFRELHVARNLAEGIYYSRNHSDADKLEAYRRFLREIESLSRRAKRRVEGQQIYYSQRRAYQTLGRMSDALCQGTVIAMRDGELVATLLQRGN